MSEEAQKFISQSTSTTSTGGGSNNSNNDDDDKKKKPSTGDSDKSSRSSVNFEGLLLPVDDNIKGWIEYGTKQALGRDGGVGASNEAITSTVKNPTEIITQK